MAASICVPGRRSSNRSKIPPQSDKSLSSLKYSRDTESRSDREGLVLMYKSGFNIRESAAFFKVLLSKGETFADKYNFISDHPPTKERINVLEKLAMTMENNAQTENIHERTISAKDNINTKDCVKAKNGVNAKSNTNHSPLVSNWQHIRNLASN